MRLSIVYKRTLNVISSKSTFDVLGSMPKIPLSLKILVCNLRNVLV